MPSKQRAKVPPGHDRGLTAVTVRGFKSLLDPVEVELRPLTVLAGANSSGKSSIMQPLLLLKQTIEAPYDPGTLLIDGPNVRFTSSSQILSRSASGTPVEGFTVTLEADHAHRVSLGFRKPVKGPLVTSEMRVQSRGERPVVLQPGMNNEAILKELPPNLKSLNRMVFSGEKLSGRWQVGKARGFLRAELRMGSDNIPVQFPADFTEFAAQGHVINHLRRIIHVPGLRGDPQRTQKTTAVSTVFPGTFELYVASVINHWQETDDHRLGRVGSALESLGLTWRVVARRVDDTRVELRVSRVPNRDSESSRDLVSIADVGFGVSQILPVLVALQAAEPGQMVYVEQPEIHLHPRAQIALAKVFADAVLRGIRVVIETHSSLLIQGLQTLVAEGRLQPETVGLHWFARTPKGFTTVTSAELDRAGRFGEWPEDFDAVSFDAERRYLDAVDEIEGAQ